MKRGTRQTLVLVLLACSLLAGLGAAPAAHAQLTPVQTASSACDQFLGPPVPTCTHSLSATFGSDASAGDSVIVYMSVWEDGASGGVNLSVSDNLGDGYRLASNSSWASPPSNNYAAIFYAPLLESGGPLTVNASFGSTNVGVSWHIEQLVAYEVPHGVTLQNSSTGNGGCCVTMMNTSSMAIVGDDYILVGGAITDACGQVTPTPVCEMTPADDGWTNTTFFGGNPDETGAMWSTNQSSPTAFAWTEPTGVSNWAAAGAEFVVSTCPCAVTVQTEPANLSLAVSVNGSSRSTTQTFIFPEEGTVLKLSAISSLCTDPLHCYVFSHWSDSGSETHYITVEANATYTAYYSAGSVTTCAGNPLQLLERGCIIPSIVYSWSYPLGLGPYLSFLFMGINVALYNKTQSIWITLVCVMVLGGVIGYALPGYFGQVIQIFTYIAVTGFFVKLFLMSR